MPLDGFVGTALSAPEPSARHRRGRLAHLSGQAAEVQVQAHYQRRGYRLVESRWRSRAGEIDLILQDGPGFVFVEVKKSRTFDQAAAALSRRQQMRILRAAEDYLGQRGHSGLTDMRFDVALLNGRGELRILENALTLW